MNATGDLCWICGGRIAADTRHGYRRCVGCGHERRASEQPSPPMVNETLAKERIIKGDFLSAFKRRTVVRVARERRFLLDVGSGSGAFLWHVRDLFASHLGIEVSRECVRFSREELGVNVVADAPAKIAPLSVATLWHSLEHMKSKDIDTILGLIASAASEATRLIISVPNCRSILYRLIGKKYPYYDIQNHEHQFSPQSIEGLLLKYGFVKSGSMYSPAYSGFAWLQGLLNCFTPQRNYLYTLLRRGQAKRNVRLIWYSAVMAAVLAPFALAACCLEVFMKKRAAVITVSARPLPKEEAS